MYGLKKNFRKSLSSSAQNSNAEKEIVVLTFKKSTHGLIKNIYLLPFRPFGFQPFNQIVSYKFRFSVVG